MKRIKAKDNVIIAEVVNPGCHKVDGVYHQYKSVLEDDLYQEMFIKEDETESCPAPHINLEHFRDHFNV